MNCGEIIHVKHVADLHADQADNICTGYPKVLSRPWRTLGWRCQGNSTLMVNLSTCGDSQPGNEVLAIRRSGIWRWNGDDYFFLKKPKTKILPRLVTVHSKSHSVGGDGRHVHGVHVVITRGPSFPPKQKARQVAQKHQALLSWLFYCD